MFSTYKSQFGLTDDDEMEFVDEGFVAPDSTDTIDKGSVYTRYQQEYKGYVVENKTVSVLSKCGVALMVTGDFAKDLDIDVSTPLSEEDALDSVFAHFDSSLGFSWNDSEFVDRLIRMTEDTSGNYDSSVTSYPTGELIIAMKHGQSIIDTPTNYALCWKFNISYLDTITKDSVLVDTVNYWQYNVHDTFVTNRVVYVNANNGDIWAMYDPTQGAFMTQGQVLTWFHGNRTDFHTAKVTFGFNYHLTDLNDNFAIVQWDGLNTDLTQTVKGSDNIWTNMIEREHASVHWCLQRSFDYYTDYQYANISKDLFAVTYYNDNLNIGAAYTPPFSTPFNINKHIILVAPGIDVYSSANLDLISHEFCHMVNYERGKVGVGLHKYHEASYINEGFADIFGELTSRYVFNNMDWSWNNYGFWGNLYKRSFHDPQNDNFPNNTASADQYYPPGTGNSPMENFVPYSGSGPMRKWFNHLSQGEWNWTPAYSGVGLNEAELITWLTFFYIVNNSTNYKNLADGTLAVAAFHRGGICSPTWRKVERAWYDVGVKESLTRCLPIIMRGPGVAEEADVTNATVSGQGVVFMVTNFDLSGYTVDDIDWLLPSHWSGVYGSGNTTFKLEDVDDDFSSQEVKAVIEYTDSLSNTYTDTLTTVLHFSNYCDDESAGNKPGMLNISSSTKFTDNERVKIYPNPAYDKLRIEGGGVDNNYEIYDMIGKVIGEGIINSNIENIDISSYRPGVYILQLKNSEGVIVSRKFVKE